MLEEWRTKAKLLQELDALRSRAAQLGKVERKKRDEELKEPEQTFRTLFDSVDEGVLLANVKNKQFVTGNKAICQMLGCNLEEITNLGIMDIHPQEDWDYLMEQFEKQARGELALAKDIPVKRKDGSILYADINSFPVTLAGRTYLMSVFRETLPQKAKSILQQDTSTSSYAGKPLTASEMRIFELLANGMNNKEIAHLLHRSVRTIEWHRVHVMHKLGVDNLADLVKRAAVMGLVDLPVTQRRGKTARNSENHP